jgi:hypothetical protein
LAIGSDFFDTTKVSLELSLNFPKEVKIPSIARSLLPLRDLGGVFYGS